MEAKTLNSIKDEIAIKHGYKNFDDLCGDNWSELDSVEPYLDEAAELYAQQIAAEACKKQREICAENAMITTEYITGKVKKVKEFETSWNTMVTIDKPSILTAPLATDKK